MAKAAAITLNRAPARAESYTAASVVGLLPYVSFLAFAFLMALGLFAANQESKDFARYEAERNSVLVYAPSTSPRVSQRSIELAMEIFGIDAPANLVGPFLDKGLYDRGLTTGDTLGNKKTVTIGPAAFTSWGILGSTLGHEIEVHAKQSFLKIVLLDRVQKAKVTSLAFLSKALPPLKHYAEAAAEVEQGTWAAEREAYHYELKEARRFHLSESEVSSIEQIMNAYYPETGVSE